MEDIIAAVETVLDEDLAAIHRVGDDLGLVTRGEFNKLIHMVQALRSNVEPPPPNPTQVE